MPSNKETPPTNVAPTPSDHDAGTENQWWDRGEGRRRGQGYDFFYFVFTLAYIYGPKNYDDDFNFPNDGEPVICPNPPP